MKKLKNGFCFDIKTEHAGLKRSFQIPPFSVLSSREGWWQKRKRAWLRFGVESENGRGEELTLREAKSENDFAGLKMQKCSGGTSIFDPVLCELAYRWFCINGGVVIDPFAGGSVRGIVANYLGYEYWGCELREEQVQANQQQAKNIIPENTPTWCCGDSSREMRRKAPEADFLFSCPPYGNLEVYSDNPKDISNKSYTGFLSLYSKIIKHSCSKLKQDRFACFVVANYRDKAGFYHNFVGDTISIFEENGCRFYNDAILMTPTGSLPIRVGKQFQSGRKLGKTHQNVLVFYKGDPKNIKSIFGKLINNE